MDPIKGCVVWRMVPSEHKFRCRMIVRRCAFRWLSDTTNDIELLSGGDTAISWAWRSALPLLLPLVIQDS